MPMLLASSLTVNPAYFRADLMENARHSDTA
jgi:hypothetical protein